VRAGKMLTLARVSAFVAEILAREGGDLIEDARLAAEERYEPELLGAARGMHVQEARPEHRWIHEQIVLRAAHGPPLAVCEIHEDQRAAMRRREVEEHEIAGHDRPAELARRAPPRDRGGLRR